MRLAAAIMMLGCAAPASAETVQYGQTYLTCFFDPAFFGQSIDLRTSDDAICNISVERLTKKPGLLGFGAYKKDVVELRQGTARDVFLAVERAETPVTPSEAEKCSTVLSNHIINGDDELKRVAAVPNSNLSALYCRVEATH